jgi:signal recognition particle subunit SEC65
VSIRRISAGKGAAVQKDLSVSEPDLKDIARALKRVRFWASALALNEVKRQLLGTSEEEPVLCLALASA